MAISYIVAHYGHKALDGNDPVIALLGGETNGELLGEFPTTQDVYNRDFERGAGYLFAVEKRSRLPWAPRTIVHACRIY